MLKTKTSASFKTYPSDSNVIDGILDNDVFSVAKLVLEEI